MTPFKPNLYVLSWGLYPRRVTIYLKERGILDRFNVREVPVLPTGLGDLPGKPKGTVPVLEYEPGRYIRQSSAILEYLEDVSDAAAAAAVNGRNDDNDKCSHGLRGKTPEDRARVRELLDLINEMCSLLGFYLHNASKAFSAAETQSPEAAGQAFKKVHKLLGDIDSMADAQGPFLAGGGEGSGEGLHRDRPSLADVVMLATAQFARHVYDVDLVGGYERLSRSVEAFERRESGALDEAPAGFRELARQLHVTILEE
ncbi:hypothetical protein N3K66_006237 [Trichothecium roseum]|uniref:Uncharacterized protein n=1 Tax=Trichothecium roseum TaxID=47278 RepID=A0ACC0V0G5_9HYPO|nr:hypothetical protein N3K66_006237 [Trichothecium roseum]